MKTIAITLNKKDLFFEVKNKLYAISDSRKTADNIETVDLIKVSEDLSDQNRLLSSFNKSKVEIETLLSKYSTDDATATQNETIDTTLDGTIVINLSMPDNFANTARLSNMVHNYFVDKAIFDWLEVVAPDESKPYFDMSQADAKQVLIMFNKRSKPTYVQAAS